MIINKVSSVFKSLDYMMAVESHPSLHPDHVLTTDLTCGDCLNLSVSTNQNLYTQDVLDSDLLLFLSVC